MMTSPARDDPPQTVPDPAGTFAAGAAGTFAVMSRRALLTGSELIAAVLSGAASVAPALAFNATPDENAPRYKDSEHVKTFYRVAGR